MTSSRYLKGKNCSIVRHTNSTWFLLNRFDFYLISQKTNQGTVAPTYYNVICNEFLSKPHGIQQLSFKLCHNYFNWSGTTRIPSVVQYAKKLAFLTQESLKGDDIISPDIPMERQLFFLWLNQTKLYIVLKCCWNQRDTRRSDYVSYFVSRFSVDIKWQNFL